MKGHHCGGAECVANELVNGRACGCGCIGCGIASQPVRPPLVGRHACGAVLVVKGGGGERLERRGARLVCWRAKGHTGECRFALLRGVAA